ncbi:hypothetical protein ACFVXQ_16980, partial [Kitasatospora sp. NPDC058263]
MANHGAGDGAESAATGHARAGNAAQAPDGAGHPGHRQRGWERPEDVLAQVVAVLGAPRPQLLPRLSGVLADLVPHTALAQLSGVCTYSPALAHGPTELTGRITTRELARLAEAVAPGLPW